MSVCNRAVIAIADGGRRLVDDAGYHFDSKTTGLVVNETKARWEDKMNTARSAEEKNTFRRKLHNCSHFKWNKCRACGKRTPQGCKTCGFYLHLDPECWNTYHEGQYGTQPQRKRSRRGHGAHLNTVAGVERAVNEDNDDDDRMQVDGDDAGDDDVGAVLI